MNTLPLTPVAGWKTRPEAHPHCTTSGIAYDHSGRVVLIHRSDKVRSAKNCWSIPSGLHEVGVTLEEQFATELTEELGLIAEPSTAIQLGVYENIAVGDGWHWVIYVCAMRVQSFDTLVNNEPDKHDIIEVLEWHDFVNRVNNGTWAPNLGQFLQRQLQRGLGLQVDNVTGALLCV